MKKNLLKFMAGAAVGAGLTMAANKYLESDKGKKTTESVKKMFSDFYNFIAPEIKMVKRLTQAKYKQIISAGAEEYGKAKKLSDETIKELIDKTMSMWDDFLENK